MSCHQAAFRYEENFFVFILFYSRTVVPHQRISSSKIRTLVNSLWMSFFCFFIFFLIILLNQCHFQRGYPADIRVEMTHKYKISVIFAPVICYIIFTVLIKKNKTEDITLKFKLYFLPMKLNPPLFACYFCDVQKVLLHNLHQGE